MNNFLILTKVLFKNGGNPFESGFENKKRKSMFIIVLLCFAPLIIQNTILLTSSYDMFSNMNIESQVMLAIFSSGSLAMIMFGIFYSISVYYFSEDVETLLSLPLRPYQIVASKFAIILFYEYFIELLFILPVFISYGLKIGNIIYFIYSIIIFLFLPVVPVVICSFIGMIIMTFTRFARDKDKFKIIAGIMSIIVALGINLIIVKFTKLGEDGQIGNVIQSNIATTNKFDNIFPSVKLATNVLIHSRELKSIVNLIAFIFINIGAVILILIFSESLYLKGAIDVSVSSYSKKGLKNDKTDKVFVQRPKIMAYLLKELKILFRTPTYFLNCILGGIVFPPIILFILIFEDSSLNTFIKSVDPKSSIFLIVSTASIVFLSSFNMITPTSISREGDNLYICRYIPISYKNQIMAKVLSGVVISYISMVIMILMAAFIFKIKYPMILLIFIISAIEIFSLSFIGILIDLKYPKLNWDNETKAVKQNFNVGINMIVIVLILSIYSYVLAVLNLSLSFTFLCLLVFYMVLAILLYKMVVIMGVDLISG